MANPLTGMPFSTGGIDLIFVGLVIEHSMAREGNKRAFSFLFFFWDRGSIGLKNCHSSKSELVLYKHSMQVASVSSTKISFALYQ